MVDLDKLNKWLALFANVGVLLGIIALVYELNQSTRLAEVQAFQIRNSEIQEASVELALSPQLIEVMIKYESEGIESLDPVEFRQVQTWNRAVIRRIESQYYQWANGFLEDEVMESIFLRLEGGVYDRWAALGVLNTIDSPSFLAEIEQRLQMDRL